MQIEDPSSKLKMPGGRKNGKGSLAPTKSTNKKVGGSSSKAAQAAKSPLVLEEVEEEVCPPTQNDNNLEGLDEAELSADEAESCECE